MTAATLTLQDLIHRVNNADNGAKATLMERLYPLIEDLCRRWGYKYPKQEWEEALGKVIIWCYSDLEKLCHRYDPEKANPTTYFRYLIGASYLNRYHRECNTLKRTMVTLDDTPESHIDPGLSVVDELSLHEQISHLRLHAKALKEPDRTIFFEHMIGPLSGAETAKRLGMNVATVYKRVERIKAALADSLKTAILVVLTMTSGLVQLISSL